MYAIPNSFKSLVRDLAQATGLSKSDARLLVHVEITLSLAIQLGFDAEPLTVGWVLLSRTPLHHPHLNALTPTQRRMQANAALIVPFSSRFAWEDALVRYAKIPAHLRLYAVQALRLDEQMIAACRQEPCPDPPREEIYRAILTESLAFEQRKQMVAEAGKTYTVRAKSMTGETHIGRIPLDFDFSRSVAHPAPWFDAPRPRNVITLSLDDLKPTAGYLDAREVELGERPRWVTGLQNIHFRSVAWVDDQPTLADEGKPLHLEGAVHLPGIVSAGKSTLATLIIAHSILNQWDVRITLVVGDSHTAIETAHRVNSWFCDDPAGDDVVAVPLLGRSQRETHLGRLLASREYERCCENGRPHWGERWLMPVCPLSSHIKWEDSWEGVISAGSEPCERLSGPPKGNRGKGERHLCPLFDRCPAQQMFRDMPRARLWVTTPGALSQAALPLHLDRRFLKMGDLVYEQSDLVIFDEVETVAGWFDHAFAQHEHLSNGKNGLLDSLESQISRYWIGKRPLPQDERRWIVPTWDASKVLSAVLTIANDPQQERTVQQWIRRGDFSPSQLAFRLARRLAGLKEWDNAGTLPEERRQNEERARTAFAPFNVLLNQTRDPLRSKIPPNSGSVDAAGELAQLMQTLNNLTDDVADAEVYALCRGWIEDHYPDIEDRLAALKAQLQRSTDANDRDYLENHLDRSIDELAQRLRFFLMVALLDRHIYALRQEWHNKPDALEAQEPFSRIPAGMRQILPLPLTGQQFGFRRPARQDDADLQNHLSLFVYANIGRSYVLDFDHLRQDIEGTPGPHVLALSATSYLPNSTVFHVPLPPAGVLLAPPKMVEAIQRSRFIWRYFTDNDGPIFVSGRQDKDRELRRLMRAMLADGGLPGGFLYKTLAWLEKQAQAEPEDWEDRARLLLLTNSYTQAAACARVLRYEWREQARAIFHLKRGKDDEDYIIEGESEPNTLKRTDIEQFAGVGGRILVAPMQSIGRSFNIMNRAAKPKAAFGAVFFLTRPLPPPHNAEAMAQELNRYALEWAANPGFGAWTEDTLYKRAISARNAAVELRRMIEQRQDYAHLIANAEMGIYPRLDLAATTVGRIVQAVGRLMRGNAPFRAYFVDAAWSPQVAKTGDEYRYEPEDTSLLTAMINILSDYAAQDVIGEQLFSSLSEALDKTENWVTRREGY